ncbi:MAG: hypothetical protein WKF67_02405 [Rubrobacteraceae bacterium]
MSETHNGHDHPHEEIKAGAGSGLYAGRIRAIEALLVERGILTQEEVQSQTPSSRSASSPIPKPPPESSVWTPPAPWS